MYKIILPLLLFASCSGPSFKSTEVCDTLMIRRMEAFMINDSLRDLERFDYLMRQNDTLKDAVRFIGTLAVKHDSVVADKQWKRDRAFRRGEFWAGIAKGFLK